ncbi:MAG: hypothetical protein R2834_01820 [Rhodothermales bacterium]
MTRIIPARARGVLLAGLLVAGLVAPARAQHRLYAGLIQNKGYVVGAPLTDAGFHVFAGDSTWTHIGWKIPRVFGIAFDPSDPRTIYLAAGNGLLRSFDGGASWRIVTDWRITEVQDVEVDPQRPERIYLSSADGVWRSHDRGDTWAFIGGEVLNRYVQAVEVDRSASGRLLAGAEHGLYRSEDDGATWTRVAEVDDVMDIQQSASEPGVWLAGMARGGVMASNDGGRTWTRARGRTQQQTFYGVAIDPANARRMAAVGWDTGVLISANGGRTWKRTGDRLPVDDFYEVIFDPDVSGRIWVATVEAGIFYSDDDGKRWTSAGMFGTLVFDMTFAPAAD